MLELGKKYRFTYLKNVDEPSIDTETCYSYPVLYDYKDNAVQYEGKLESVRDINDSPLANATISYSNIKGKRSQYLCYFKLDNGDIKAFYDGCMVSVEEVKPVTRVRSLMYRLGKPFQRKRRLAALRA